MNVPQHISVTGETRPSPHPAHAVGDRAWMEREKVVGTMNVPERILVAGGDAHFGDRSQPTEVIRDQLHTVSPTLDIGDLPDTLTLDKQPFPDVVEPANAHEESMSQASIAIEENPLQELKLMRRQLGRISSRLYQLEDDYERRKNREFFYMISIFGFAAALLFSLLRK